MEKSTLGKKRLGDLLCKAGLITETDLKRAIKEQKKTGMRVGASLIALNIVTEFDIAKTLSEQLGIEYISLRTAPIEPDAIAAVPQSVAVKYACIPIYADQRYLTVAMTDPLDYDCMKDIEFRCDLEVKPLVATRGEIFDAIQRHYNLDDSIENMIRASSKDTVDGEKVEIAPMAASHQNPNPEDLKQKSEAAPIVRLFNLIFVRAMKARASDIHLDPHQDKLAIRFRVDGILQNDRSLPKEMQGALVSRIKVLALLDISERRLPQDGGIRIRYNHRNIDLRVSTLPTHYGEKVVIRILDQNTTPQGLEGTGISEKNLEIMMKFSKRRQGILLVTGPTGSGKSSTLYSFIHQVRTEKVNIMTVEDPIEYNIDGLNQTQVKPGIGLTFANCLRSILRQDPNVIMLGEIRDLETAEIAFRAAMTGHLVISTLHTNDAVSTVTRLIDMGIPRYLIASSLIGIVAQRLVRKICKRCRTDSTPATPAADGQRNQAYTDEAAGSYHGAGCVSCRHTGFFGRVGLFEILKIEKNVKEIIAAGGDEEVIRKVAEKQGLRTIGEDGLEKVRQGTTTLEEVLRVIEVEEAIQTLCPSCHQSIHHDFIACPHCKYDIQLSCASCKKYLQPGWLICPYCRQEPQKPLIPVETTESRLNPSWVESS
ncbi:MAG: ATPase, T2SS/T4P/T4SS family [Nitrospiria bacterium]